jgi:hypothetical protein
MSTQEYRNKMLAELRRSCSHLANNVEEYIAECEQQEGIAYWQQFETIAEMIEDFMLYVEYSDD